MARKRPSRQSKKRVDVYSHVEASQTDPLVRTAEATAASVSSRPIATGDEIGLLETVQTGPNGAVNWYVNGPPGAQVTIGTQRIAGSGGHNHGGNTGDPNAVGQIAPAAFTLPSPYPQNVRCVYRATSACGSTKLTFRFSTGNPPTIDNYVEVLLTGLTPIYSSASLQLKPPLAEHPSPYWAAPAFLTKLVQLANTYFAERNRPLTVTDATLAFDQNEGLHQKARMAVQARRYQRTAKAHRFAEPFHLLKEA